MYLHTEPNVQENVCFNLDESISNILFSWKIDRNKVCMIFHMFESKKLNPEDYLVIKNAFME